jgi:lycopene beta-cyclase
VKKKQINIIGAGCAGLSLARFSNELKEYQFNVFSEKKIEKTKDHYWGFWKNSFTEDAYNNANCTWSKWPIITNEAHEVLTAKKHIAGHHTFDSRPPSIPSNTLLQHFEGYVITSKNNIFNPEIVRLMDFRCDQSKGIHFIYLLPLSKKSALVESTLFSKNIESSDFYFNSIKIYLKKYYDLTKFSMKDFEKGIIPMNDLSMKSIGRYNIGMRGGAIRPSSGYAFIYIQKQINKIIKNLIFKEKINTKVHKNFDLFMDRIFLMVLDLYPEKAPKIFLKLAQAINGDEMAMFMSGEFKASIWFKIIMSMPKICFIKAFYKVIIR